MDDDDQNVLLYPPSWYLLSNFRHAANYIDDPLTVVLRAHLALEATIEIAASSRLKKPEAILNNRTTFATKLALMQSLFGDELEAGCYRICKLTNQLRNDYAHNLQPVKARELFIDILTTDLQTMPRKAREELVDLPEKALVEILFYKIQSGAQHICNVFLAAANEEHGKLVDGILSQLQEKSQKDQMPQSPQR